MAKNLIQNWWATPLIGICGAQLATWANWPLPWIIGSLLAVSLIRCCGWLITEIPYGRNCGQWLIATAMGLHFTNAVIINIFQQWSLILSAAILTLLLAILGIALMSRHGVNFSTAYFAFMPANFSEMVQLGERYGADAKKIALAHTFRITLIVLLVPPLFFFFIDIPPNVIHFVSPTDWNWLTPMLIGGLFMILLWRKLRLPNAWMFAPLVLCASITGFFDLNIAMPKELSHFGQLMIGCALGSHFDRKFLKSSPPFIFKTVLYILVMISSTILLAYILNYFIHVPILTIALGMMPGSSTEMYLTAEALSLGVATVTAMQITRLIIIMIIAEPLYIHWFKVKNLKENN